MSSIFSLSPSRSSGMSDSRHFIMMRPTTSLRSTAPVHSRQVTIGQHAACQHMSRSTRCLACRLSVRMLLVCQAQAVQDGTSALCVWSCCQQTGCAPVLLMSRLTSSTMSRNTSFLLYLSPGRRQLTAPVTVSVAFLACCVDCACARVSQHTTDHSAPAYHLLVHQRR